VGFSLVTPRKKDKQFSRQEGGDCQPNLKKPGASSGSLIRSVGPLHPFHFAAILVRNGEDPFAR
jgi:hypothetical protein